jgi:3-oxoacyl-[acyl-carrier-protein] synthase-3
VQHKLGLPGDSSGFDVSLGCSGYVYGLDITKAYMAANGFRRGLLFTADPYSKILDPSDRNTELLFGDAATCTLMGETPRYTVGKPVYATDGGKGSYISRATAQSKLAMNGKEVFMFVLKNVPGQVRACLEAEGLPSSEVGLFVFHQGSRYMVENLAKTLQLDPERVPFLASEVGNTVSSTIPLILSDYIGDGPAHVLLSGFGVGLSAASVILKRDNS